MLITRIAGALALGLLGGWPLATPATAEPGFVIEEVVVTARRREEPLQLTPVAVSALPGDALQMRQIRSSDQLAEAVPNLVFDSAAPSSGSSSVAQIFIRGIGQTDYTPVTDPGVGLYLDGVYLARSPGNVIDFVDIDRVEILRGPQGTLFGRNTIGGAINILTRRPSVDDARSSLRLHIGSDRLRSVTAKHDLVLGDEAAASLAGNWTGRDGYVARPLAGNRTGDRDRLTLRGALHWAPDDDFSLYATTDFSRIDENGAPIVSGGLNDRQPFATFGNAVLASCGAVVVNPNFDGTPAGGPPTLPPPGAGVDGAAGCYGAGDADPPYVSGGTFPVRSDLDIVGATVELRWRPGAGWEGKSISALRSMDMESSRDGDNTPANVFATQDSYRHEQLSQEFQLHHLSTDARRSTLLGLYLFAERGANLVGLTLPTGAIQSGGAYDNRSQALFFQTSYALTDTLNIAVGGRYTRDRKAFHPDQFVLGDASDGPVADLFPPTWPLLEDIYLGPTGPLAAGTRILRDERSAIEFDNGDLHLNVSYALTPDVLTYLSYSTGYKSGGFDQRFVGPTPDGLPSTYRPEYVRTVEAGWKSDLLDGRLRLNAAAFHAEYDELQIIVRESFNPLTFNAGAARVRGGELELTWVPVPSWQFDAALGLLDAGYRSLSPDAEASGVALDNDLVKAPPRNASLGAAWRRSLGAFGTATARIDWSWHDVQYNDAVNSELTRQGAYGLLHASLSVASRDEQWWLMLAGRNLTDERYLVAGASAFDTAAAYVERVYGRPSEWSLSLERRF